MSRKLSVYRRISPLVMVGIRTLVPAGGRFEKNDIRLVRSAFVCFGDILSKRKGNCPETVHMGIYFKHAFVYKLYKA